MIDKIKNFFKSFLFYCSKIIILKPYKWSLIEKNQIQIWANLTACGDLVLYCLAAVAAFKYYHLACFQIYLVGNSCLAVFDCLAVVLMLRSVLTYHKCVCGGVWVWQCFCSYFHPSSFPSCAAPCLGFQQKGSAVRNA